MESPIDTQPVPELRFQKGRIYHRQRDIHLHFGGSRQSGISPSARVPAVFIFTGDSGEQYGYRDDFRNGVFFYTGEGQVGDMQLKVGNAAIAYHAEKGKALHLFRALGKGKGCEYLGEYACAGYSWGRGPDLKKKERVVIIFQLVPVEEIDEAAASDEVVAITEATAGEPRHLLAEARKQAFNATNRKATTAIEPAEARRILYQRCEKVRRYVLMRAAGTCESCRQPAPFQRKDGTPYLEPHHINRLSDGGLDHPRFVGAICPACHCEIHYGIHGKAKNESLRSYVEQIEAAPLSSP